MTLCHGEDPELWFPERRNTTAQAVAICHRCPVLEDCRQLALKHRIAHGIWGGLTEDERRKILHQRKPRLVKTHPASQSPSEHFRLEKKHPASAIACE